MEGFTGDGGQSVPLARWRSNFSRRFQYYLDKSTPHPFYRWLGTSVAAIIYILRVYYVQGFYIVSYGLGIYVLNLLIGFLSPQVDPEIEGMDGVSLPTKGSDEFRPFVRRLPEFKFCLSMVILLLFYAIFFPDVLGRSLVNNIEWDIQITPQAVRDPDAYVARRNNINDNIPIVWSRVFVSIFPVTLMLFVDIIRYSITKAFCIAFLMTFFSVFDVPVFWPILLCYWVVLFVLTMKRQIMHMIKYKYVPFSVGKRRYSGKKPASDKASTSRE